MNGLTRPPPGALAPPVLATVREYGARLGDARFWGPYVREVLSRHGLPVEAPRPGFVGTFPTFLAGRYVVKLFGELFDGAARYETELSVQRLLATQPDIPAPTLVAHGRLFDHHPPPAWPWPYLVTSRLPGTAWRDAALHPQQRAAVARRLGLAIRRVHRLLPPGGPGWDQNRPAGLRAGCVARHRGWGTLPAQLIEQIDRFLVEPSSERRLVHADLTGDHLFVHRRRLVGIIDWGDALLTDPYYDLPALHLHAFGGDKRLLAAFLEGYGWEIGADFARRAMTMTLAHEFNVLSGVRTTPALDKSLDEVATLEELSSRLWGLP